jgi:hypothetical protein
VAGWLRSAPQAPATAETSSRLSPVNCTTPASFRFAAAARSARQAIGRPPPSLAGQRSAFLPTARRAPLSHNGAWWIAEICFEGFHRAIHHDHYAKRPPLRSTRRGFYFDAIEHRSRRGGGVDSRWQTATASPRPPKACRRAGSLRSRPGSRPHAEQGRPARPCPPSGNGVTDMKFPA